MNLRTTLLRSRLIVALLAVVVGLTVAQTTAYSQAASCIPVGYRYATYNYEMFMPSITINGTTSNFTVSGPDVAGAGVCNTNVAITGLPGGTVTINSFGSGLSYNYYGSVYTGYGGYWQVSCDWNNNGVFTDAGEIMPAQTSTYYYTTVPYTFTIPSTVTPGPKRMRITMSYTSAYQYTDPCNVSYTYYNDFKDFLLNIGYNNDLAATGISTTTTPPFAPGLNDIVLKITNNGLNTVTAGTFNYTLTPSTGSPVTATATFSGSLAAGASTNVILSAGYNFPAVGSVAVSASVATVNGSSDGNSANNSASGLLGAGLNGTYTIGGSSPNFTSINQAASQLNAGGTIGPVTLNIRPGTYTENVYLANIPGNVSTKPIVFQSENGNKNSVILQFSNTSAAAITGTTSIGGTPTLRMNNADYISFKNFTIAALNTAATFGNGVELVGATGGASGCDGVTFDNMVFNGVTSTSTFLGDVFFLSVNSGQHNNLAVTNCTFNNASIPFYYDYTLSSYATGINISKNTFSNYGAYAMRLAGTDGATVNGNTWTTTSAAMVAGVIFVNHNGLFNFRKNRIMMTINNGIAELTSGSRNGTSQAVFANNFIRVNGTSGVGMSATGSTNVGVFHNTISNATAGSAFTVTSGTTISCVNNIFSNAGTGVAFTGASGLTANYNDYFTSGVNLAIWNGAAYPTMAAYRSASGQDLNSSNATINFVNAPINDLSLTIVNTALYGIGSTSNGTYNIGIRGTVSDDIFDQTRNRDEVFMGAHQLIPVISFSPAPPASLTGCANQTLTVSANAVVTFGAQLSFSWMRNGAPLLDGVNGVSGASTNTLTITNAQPSLNGGDYVLRVTATGGADPLVSNIISVVVNAPIQINIQPASRVICLGNETSMSVVASGTILGYQWYKDGQAISGATSPIYVLSNAGFQMSGRYRCVMAGTCGTTTVASDDAVVYVASSTLIGRDPDVSGAAVGSTGYLSIEVNATAQIPGYSPQFQWYQGGNMLTDNGRLSGTTTNQLTIRNMQAADIAQNYYCVVTGVCGSQTSKQGGFYISQISIQNQPSSQEVCSNSDASLMVSATSNIPNVQYSYVWMLDGKPLSDNANYSGTSTNMLTVKKAGATQAGDYTVKIIANPTGATLISNAATVSVISSPVISTQPKSMSVCEGDPITMTVAATGGTLSYQWKVGSAMVPGATAATVSVPAADLSMNGAKVTCVISNNCGTSTTDEAVVTVNSKPTITVGPNNSAVVVGSNFVLSVVASNAVSYQWKMNGANIPGATTASYTLSSFTTGMAGNYMCEVTNACGTVNSGVATLTVSGREEEAEAAGFSLSNAVPTPTIDNARINFSMPTSAHARISMSDAYGREVAVLFDGIATIGSNVATIDASKLANGVYTYTLSSSTYSITRTMVVAK